MISMKRLMIAIAFAVASTTAFGIENQDYNFNVVVQTGQTVDGYPLAAFTPPAINNLDSIIFGGYATIPIAPNVTYFAGCFRPKRTSQAIPPLQIIPVSLRMPSMTKIRLPL